MSALPWLTDDEVNDLCAGLVQDAAKVRYLKGLGLRVDRKPNGKPLAWRPTEPQAQNAPEQQAGPADVVQSLRAWADKRKQQRGQATQGR